MGPYSIGYLACGALQAALAVWAFTLWRASDASTRAVMAHVYMGYSQ